MRDNRHTVEVEYPASKADITKPSRTKLIPSITRRGWRETACEAIIVDDHCLDADIIGKLDAEGHENLPRISQEISVLPPCRFPEVKMPRLIINDLGPSRQVY
jgi:hypothetical protein